MAVDCGRKYKMLEKKHALKETVLAYKIALKSKMMGKPVGDRPVYIAMIDGSAVHGGMCDRFKAIISLYAYCKYTGNPFRIKYTYPFKLEDYLSPATYDWRIKEGEYTDNPRYSRILYMRKEYLARRLLKLKTQKQIHFYGNRDSLAYINESFLGQGNASEAFTWGGLFRELFRPGPVLEERIQAVSTELGDNYDAAVFRFQNLLGDFKEYSFKSIGDKSEAEKLIEKCLQAIKALKADMGDRALLVTSDSVTFLQRAVQIEGVHIIPGKLVHMDGCKDEPVENKYEIYLKSFLDFYVLSGARKIYRIGTSYMYPSEFPMYAAKVHDIPFESIVI